MMIIEASLIVAIIAAGKAADTYASDRLKRIFRVWLRQSRSFNWHEFVAQRSWRIYTAVFGAHSTSVKFLRRSLFLYLCLCLASVVFLGMFFPSTFASVVSVWKYGSLAEQLWWTLSVALGGMLYVLANAQTLYFLEILRTAPSFFKFVLVAYADFLITASISLFGVSALLTVNTLGLAVTASDNVALKVDFSRMRQDHADETSSRLADGANAAPVERATTGTPPTSLTVRFEFKDPERDLEISNADYDIFAEAIRSRQVGQAASMGRDGSIFYRTFDTFVAVSARGRPYRGQVSAHDAPGGASAREVVDRFCRDFASGALGAPQGYVQSPRMPDVARSLYSSCREETSVTVAIPARLNTSRIEINKLYKTYLLISLSDLTFSASSGFQSYLAMSPYALIRVEDPAQVWNHYAAFEGWAESGRAYDRMVAEAYFRQTGADKVVLHRGIPAGTINFAIMSTALFNLVVMSVFFILFPMMNALRRYRSIKGYLALAAYPFTLFAGVVAAWAGIIWLLVRLL